MLKGKKFNAFALLTTSTTYPISPNNLSYLFQQQEEGE